MHSTFCALTEMWHPVIELLNSEGWIGTQRRVRTHARTHTHTSNTHKLVLLPTRTRAKDKSNKNSRSSAHFHVSESHCVQPFPHHCSPWSSLITASSFCLGVLIEQEWGEAERVLHWRTPWGLRLYWMVCRAAVCPTGSLRPIAQTWSLF